MAKGNFTYVVGLEGGVEEGPMSLADLQPRVRDGRVVGSTFIKRSDRAEWTTAADLPELKVKDVIIRKDLQRESSVGEEMAKELCLRKVRSGVNWLFWIGALSLLNSALAWMGVGKTYAVGLGAAQLIAALGDYYGGTGMWVSLGANVAVSFAFLVTGALAWHGKLRLLGPAIAVYIADLVLCVVFEQWVSVGLHALALFFLIEGLIASYGARGVEPTWQGWAAHGTTAVILSVAGFGSFKFLEKAMTPAPAAWATSAPAKWPQMSVANAADFKGHTPLRAGNSFFMRLRSGTVVVGTARHLLGPAGGVEPTVKLSEIDSSIEEWNLRGRGTNVGSANVAGLHGSSANYSVLSDWLILRVAPEDVAKLPAEPLAPRLTLVEAGETVYLVGTGASGKSQEIHAAKVLEADDYAIDAKLDKPIDLIGFSGSPVIDKNGNLVGVLTSSNAKADRQGRMDSFVAESVLEVRNLLR